MAKAKKNREASEITAREFLTAWDKATTVDGLQASLNLVGEDGKKTYQSLKGKYERMGIALKKLASNRGIQVNQEALDEAWAIQAKVTGKTLASVKKAALANREASREKARQAAKDKAEREAKVKEALEAAKEASK